MKLELLKAVRTRPVFAACAVMSLLLAGCTAAKYRRSADKEAYAVIREKTPLVNNMEPQFTIEQTNVLSLDRYPRTTQTNDFLGQAAAAELGASIISLQEALAISVKYSRIYQNNKEQLYLSALGLTLARHTFTPIFSSGGSGSFSEQNSSATSAELDPTTGELRPLTSEHLTQSIRANGRVGVDWLIRDIGRISTAFSADFLRFLSGGPGTTVSSELGATLTRPLLRNAGYKAEMENLTQAERDLLYALRDFVRFRKSFSVQIASAYYGVLGNRDAARNSYLNFQSSRRAGERTRALAAEGRTTQTDLGRIEQQELSAEGSWIAAVRVYQRALDDLKIQLGIPVETRMVLDDRELERLTIIQPDISVDDAIRVALTARLDYQNVTDQQADSVRKAELARTFLKPQADLFVSAGMASPQSSTTFPWPQPNLYQYSVGLNNLDLGLDRKAERNSYRSALITEERSKRGVQQRRDEIELQVRESWRSLEQARRTHQISEIGVNLAERRVEEQELLAELGRAKALDQVDAQNALLSSKDQRTQALVTHTIARIQFWENMGILFIRPNGGWEEGLRQSMKSGKQEPKSAQALEQQDRSRSESGNEPEKIQTARAN